DLIPTFYFYVFFTITCAYKPLHAPLPLVTTLTTSSLQHNFQTRTKVRRRVKKVQIERVQ
ncbi:MAG: hypothetical protein ACI9T7_002381, partial [Oleiphilaceae bacterium]